MAPLTGPKVLAITVAFFGVIIGVNLLLAFKAVSTFPGLEVANSYVASQTFNAEKAAQDGLGWSLTVNADANRLNLAFTDTAGQPVAPRSLSASIGRATEALDDSIPAFVYARGSYTAPVDLAPGKWVLRVDANAADGTPFRQRIDLFVKG